MTTTIGWTTEPPTKPGEYWLSIAPERRGPWDAVYRAEICQGQRWRVDGQWDAPNADDLVLYVGDDDDNEHLPNPWRTRRFMDDELFIGALWLERKVPADPFAQTATGHKGSDSL